MPIDTGTPELARRQKLKAERGVGVVRVRSLTTSSLDRMLYLELISVDEYSAMDDLLADVFRAGLITLKAFDPGKVRISGKTQNDAEEPHATRTDLRSRLSDTMKALERALGPKVRDLLFDLLYSPETIQSQGSMEKLAGEVRRVARVLMSR